MKRKGCTTLTTKDAGARALAVRKSLGLTMAQVAERAQISVPHVWKIERMTDAGAISLGVADRVSAALGLSIYELWGE